MASLQIASAPGDKVNPFRAGVAPVLFTGASFSFP
jgi:hypothetical protein